MRVGQPSDGGIVTIVSAPRRYLYVGPPEVAARVSGGRGEAISSRDALAAWVRANARELTADGFTATYVVTDDGAWRLAPRRSEHVACAGGGAVLAAGEVVLSRDATVVEASNLSTGYCPEPECWSALADALDRAGVPRAPGFTHAVEFRRCERCGARNVVKDGVLVCAECDADLPARWNFALTPS